MLVRGVHLHLAVVAWVLPLRNRARPEWKKSSCPPAANLSNKEQDRRPAPRSAMQFRGTFPVRSVAVHSGDGEVRADNAVRQAYRGPTSRQRSQRRSGRRVP